MRCDANECAGEEIGIILSRDKNGTLYAYPWYEGRKRAEEEVADDGDVLLAFYPFNQSISTQAGEPVVEILKQLRHMEERTEILEFLMTLVANRVAEHITRN